MLALVVGGIIALFKLQTDEFPDVAPPYVSVAVPYPGASPETVENRDPQSDRGGDRLDQRGEEGQGRADRWIRGHHDRVHLREAASRGDAGHPRRHLRESGPTCRPRWKSRSSRSSTTPTGPSMSPWRSRRRPLTPRPSSPAWPIRNHPGAALDSGRGGSDGDRQAGTRDDGRAQAAALQAAGVSVAQVVQALEAQNLAAPVGRVQGQLMSGPSGCAGARGSGGFAQLVVAERNGTLIRLARWPTCGMACRGTAHTGAFNGTEAVGIDIKKSKGNSTTDGRSSAGPGELEKKPLPAHHQSS